MKLRTLPPSPPREVVSGAELETLMDTGAIGFAKWLCRVMDHNSWSHPQLVALCKHCTGGRAWLHSSQIAGLRQARLKSPGPRSFVALEYLFRAIDDFQQNGLLNEGEVFFTGNFAELVKDAQIMRDEEGNPTSLGYLIEVFTGLRPVPIDLTKAEFSPDQAKTISDNTGRLVRKLMAVEDLDPIADAYSLASKFPGNAQTCKRFAELIRGSGEWEYETIESNVGKLVKFLKDQFGYDRTVNELLEQLSK